MDKQIKVLAIIKGFNIKTSYIRILQIFEKLDKDKYLVTIKPHFELTYTNIIDNDIIIIQRLAEIDISMHLNSAKKMKKKIIYELDDNLLNLPKESAMSKKNNNIKRNVKNYLLIADIVTCSTERLKNELTNYINENKIVVIKNVIDTEKYLQKIDEIELNKPLKNNKIKLILSNTDYFKLINKDNFINNIKRILTEYKDKVKLFFVGKFDLLELSDFTNIEIIKELTYSEYFNFLIKENFDIALIPLEDTQFHRCKSNIKYLDFSILKIAGIFSKVEPYTRSIEHKYNGILINNEEKDGWYNSIKSLIENSVLRKKISENAFNDVIKNYDINYAIEKWENLLSSLYTTVQKKYSSEEISIIYNDLLQKKEKELKQKEKELKNIYNSDLWKMATKLNKIAKKTRIIYLIKGLLVLKREGIGGLIKAVSKKLYNKNYTKKIINISEFKSNDKILPVSVALIDTASNKVTVNNFVLPFIKLNNPKEIIITDDENLSIIQKRIKAVHKSKEDYILFCNNNTVIPKNYINRLLKALEENKDACFAYSDFYSINMKKGPNNIYVKSKKFSLSSIKKSNYIPDVALIKRDILKNINIEKKMYDLWLNLSEKGYKGIYVKDAIFYELLNIPQNIKYIEKDKNIAKLPISVIIPTIKSRNIFTKELVIPAIEANNPAEIIIIDDENLTVQQKRNKGAEKATQKYLFFCDDDTLLPKNHLLNLYEALENNPDKGFAYTDYQAIVVDTKNHPKGGNYYHKAREFDENFLKKNNYIDTSSLVRKDVFVGWDENIKRLQDWDVWLSISLKGHKGKYVKDSHIFKFYLDEGITSKKMDIYEAIRIVKEKHNLE